MLTFRYRNGNYTVYNDSLGSLYKRCLRYGEDFKADFPDSIDLRITNKCSWSCPWCHESSSNTGRSFNYESTIELLSQLPQKPIEIAIGGGNILDIPKETLKLVNWLKDRKIRPRGTINIKDIISRNDKWTKDELELIKSIECWGISISSVKDIDNILVDSTSPIRHSESYSFRDYSSPFRGKDIVFHIIAGLFPSKELHQLLSKSTYPILILGYKQWGRAINTKIPDMKDTRNIIEYFINHEYESCFYRRILAFDNLSLEQLNIKDLISKDVWNRFYLGEEGKHSMYIDAVEETFAKTSRSEERVSWKEQGLIEYFKTL